MLVLRRSVLLAVAALLLVTTGASAKQLAGSAAPGIATYTPVGAPSSARTLRIGIALKRPDAAGEATLKAALYDEHSPEYMHFLTPARFAQRFGVDARDTRATHNWLATSGLKVSYTSLAGDYIVASGTVAQVERLTGVRLLRYRSGAKTFIANDRAPQVPDSLPVLSIVGLDSRAEHRPMSGDRRPSDAPDTGERTPQDLWAIYQQPLDNVGNGVSVGIIGSGSVDGLVDYVHEFDDANGLPQVPVDTVLTPADADYSFNGAEGEWKLDLAAVSGMAPGLDRIVLYSSPTYKDTDLLGSVAAWVNDPNGPLVFNESYGECEPTPLNSVLTNPALAALDGNENPSETQPQSGLANSSHPAEDQLLSQAVIEGRTLFASAGDAGAGCAAAYAGPVGAGNGAVEQIDGLTEDPASNPNAVGVGGTVLYTDDSAETPTRQLEYAWTHSGGNASPFQPAPDYQQGVANLSRPCVVDQSGNPTNSGELCRGVPDVAALSGDILGNGYAGSGGTSLSAPLWSGMWARVIASTPGKTGFGFANPAIYKVAKDDTRRANSFYDITTGSNGNPALPGYDYVSGWGTPNLTSLIADITETTPTRAPSTSGGSGGAGATPAPCTDKLAPTAALKRARLTRKGVRLSGTARDRGCQAGGAGILLRVEVAVARKVGSKCAFLKAKKPSSCARPRFIKAVGTGVWKLALKGRLRAGRYLVMVRATDLAGNRSAVRRRVVRRR